MKRLTLALVLLAAPAFAGWIPQTLTESTLVYTTGIYSRSAELHAVTVVDDGANVCTVNVYDNTAGSGTKVWHDIITAADQETKGSVGQDANIDTGIYVKITTAGTCTVWVYWKPVN